MKVSAIKTNVIKKFAPVAVAGTILSGCSCGSVSNKAYDYCIKTNKTAREYNEILSAYTPVQAQARLDSMAFRDIFEKTSGKDNPKLTQELETLSGRLCKVNQEDFNKTLLKEDIPLKVYKEVQEKNNWDTKAGRHHGDNWIYRNFFEKHGLMNDTIKHLCDSVQEIIKP